jgi:predicted lactoylglutathione lyase
MSRKPPDLRMVNLIVKDTAASAEFYRRLGVEVTPPDDGWGMHAALPMPGGFSLELDTPESVQLWHAGWRKDPASTSVVVCFSFDSLEAVDECYAELTGAGYVGRQPPYDAFWGARWAIVADPDGHDVGLMSPMENERRTWPPIQSPDP